MKNYSLNLEDSKTFVLNYIVKDNEIAVNLATGENYVIPYTRENEIKLLERMRSQVLKAYEFKNKQEERFSKSWKSAIFSTFMFALDAIILATGIAVFPVLQGILASWFLFYTGDRIYSMVDSRRNIKDIDKNLMFLKNEERLNKAKGNTNILANTSRKTRETLCPTPTEKPVFTFNSIDKIKYEELMKILIEKKNLDLNILVNQGKIP